VLGQQTVVSFEFGAAKLPSYFGGLGAQEIEQPGGASFILIAPGTVAQVFLRAGPSPKADAHAVEKSQDVKGVLVTHFEVQVFCSADVQDMVQAVFDAPFGTARLEELQRGELCTFTAGDQP
jgi:hypothetical protein